MVDDWISSYLAVFFGWNLGIVIHANCCGVGSQEINTCPPVKHKRKWQLLILKANSLAKERDNEINYNQNQLIWAIAAIFSLVNYDG